MKKLTLLALILMLAGCGATFVTLQQKHLLNWQNLQLGSPNNLFNNKYFAIAIAWARECQGYEAFMVKY